MSETGSVAALESLLMSRSLSDPELARATDAVPDYAVLPDVNVLKIGGQSLMDRGRSAVHPVVEELVAVKGTHKILIGAGGGYPGAARLRAGRRAGPADRGAHRRRVGGGRAERADAGLPDGPVRVPVVGGAAFGALPLYLAEAGAAIFAGMPPYDMWQHVPNEGVIRPTAPTPAAGSSPRPTAAAA